MAVLLWFAAAVALLTFGVHTFIGGPRVVRPLLANESLPPESKWLGYYCWHIATVLLAFLACAFAWLAMVPNAPGIVFTTALCLSLSVLSVAVALRGSIHPLRLPSTTLFALMAVLGGISLLVAG